MRDPVPEPGGAGDPATAPGGVGDPVPEPGGVEDPVAEPGGGSGGAGHRPPRLPAPRVLARPVRQAWAVILPMLGLGCAIAFLGSHVRPASDDYRLIVFTREGGIPGIVAEFHDRLTGRVGNAFLAGIAYTDPDLGMRACGIVTYGMLSAAVALACHGALRRLGFAPTRTVPLLVGPGLAGIALLTQPRAYQTLFWIPGVVSHVVPPAVILALAGIAVRARSGGRRTAVCAAALLTGCFLGTTSEAITLMWLALTGLVLATSAVLRGRAAYAASFALALAAGLLGGLALLSLSPGGSRRRPPGVGALDPQLLQDALVMSGAALQRMLLGAAPFAALAIGVLAGLLTGGGRRWHRRPRWSLRSRAEKAWLLALPAAAALLSVFAVQYALRYGYGPPGEWVAYRAWFNSNTVLVLAAACYGFLAAGPLSAALSGGRRGPLPPGVLGAGSCLVALAVVAGCAADLGNLGRRMAERSAAWDAQAAAIEEARARGETMIPYRRLRMARLREPSRHPGSWINVSVARFHRVGGVVVRRPRTPPPPGSASPARGGRPPAGQEK
ncbi:hypothetical protein [Planomonospora algeriensis]